jgi:hypothetical protein
MIARARRRQARDREQRQRLHVGRRPLADVLRAPGGEGAIAADPAGGRNERSGRLLAVGEPRDAVPEIERRLAALTACHPRVRRGFGRRRAIDLRRRRVVPGTVIGRRICRVIHCAGDRGAVAARRPPRTGDARRRHSRRGRRHGRDHREGEGENETEQGGRVLEVLQKAPESYSTPGVPASRRHDPVIGHCELGRAIRREINNQKPQTISPSSRQR